jgi:hypothetical protein
MTGVCDEGGSVMAFACPVVRIGGYRAGGHANGEMEVFVFARMHVLQTTAESYEEGLGLVRDQLLPWARESTGYRGLIGLVDQAHQTAFVLTLWKDGAALAASEAAGDRLSLRAAEAAGATRRSLETLEVSIFDVPAY